MTAGVALRADERDADPSSILELARNKVVAGHTYACGFIERPNVTCQITNIYILNHTDQQRNELDVRRRNEMILLCSVPYACSLACLRSQQYPRVHKKQRGYMIYI